MTAIRLVVLLAGLLLAAASTLDPGEDDLPEPDRCDAGSGGAAGLEIGAQSDPFRGLVDFEIAEVVTGGQGTEMLPLRFRVTGTGADCLTQRTVVYGCRAGEACPGDRFLIGSSDVPLRAYPDAASMATAEHFVLLDRLFEVEQLIVESEVAGAAASVRLSLGADLPPDAGLDATSDGR